MRDLTAGPGRSNGAANAAAIKGWLADGRTHRSICARRTLGRATAELTKSFVVGDDVAASLRDLQLLDRECERLVYRMVGSADGAVLTIDAEDLDELLGFVAAEANHEEDRRRCKRLDGAFLVLQGALDSFPGDEPRVGQGFGGRA